MTKTLSLDRDYLDNNHNLDDKPKKKFTFKVVIFTILILAFLLIACFSYYLYTNNKELSSINSNINTYNTLINTVNGNKNPTASDYTSYSSQFSNLSNTFAGYENSIFLGSDSKTLTTNYANITSYLSSNEKLLSEYLTYMHEVENLSSPNLDQLQALINKFNGLLSSSDFTKMKNMYSNDPFVNGNISQTSSPKVFEDMVNKTVAKLSKTSKYEVFANNIANFFGLGDIFKNSMQMTD